LLIFDCRLTDWSPGRLLNRESPISNRKSPAPVADVLAFR
jgi:hypothetical protein